MFSSTKHSILILLVFTMAFLMPGIAFSQLGNLTIKGNIKLAKEYDRDLDECCFHYKNILSDRDVIIPIRRDSAGNFSVSMQMESYQQIYFSKAIIINGGMEYLSGYIYFSFFGKPGQIMSMNFTQKPFLLSFKGDFSTENNQYQKYVNAKDKSVKNIYEGIQGKKFTPKQIKELELNSFKEQMSFNKKYFKIHPASKFIQEQAYYNALYETQGAAIQLNFLSKNKVTEATMSDFYKSMNETGTTFKDGPALSMRFMLDPNPSLKNSGATGNREYKRFIADYYSVLDRNLSHDSVQTVNFKDLAAFVIKTYPDLKQEDKLILSKFLAQKAKQTDEDTKAMVALSNLYSPQLLQIRENQKVLGKYLSIKDPALRDLIATMYLYEKLDFNQIDYLEPVIADYKQGVKNAYLKDKFLATYKDEIDRLHRTIMPDLAVLNSSSELQGPEMLKKLLEKYKGKVVYIDAWATWCGPCIAGMDASKRLRDKLKGRDIVFVYLCMDSPHENGWKNVIAAKHIEGENYFLDMSQSLSLSKSLHITAIPHYALVDQNGNIVNGKAPSPGEPEALKSINDLLK